MKWISLAIRLFRWPLDTCFALLLLPLVFPSFDHRGMILDASNLGLPCFPFPLVGLISALIVIFFQLVGCMKPLKFKGLLARRALNCIS